MTTAAAFDWMTLSACADDPGLFFGPDDETETEMTARETKAKAVCADCPVRLRCLLLAFAEKDDHGVWGGTGEAERAALRRSEMRRTASLARKENNAA